MNRATTHVLCPLLTLLVASAALADAPPREVTDRLERALKALEPPSFQGTYTVNVSSTVSKLDGSDREEEKELLELVQPATGEALSRVVRAEANGKDVTAKRQRELDEEKRQRQARSEKSDDDASGSITVTASFPSGTDAERFEFSPPVREGDLLVSTFTPRREHRDREGIMSGRLAWRADSLDPVWIQAQPVKLPKHTSAVDMRFEFRREGDLLYLGRVVTDGAGGMLWIKRKVHAEMEISDVHLAR